LQIQLKSDQRRLSISCNFYCEALGFGVLAPKAKGEARKIAGNRRFGTNQPTVVPPLVTVISSPHFWGC